MNNLPELKSNAKILLFGEYTVLLNSRALSIPFPVFSGQLRQAGTIPSKEQENSNKDLKGLLSFLRKKTSSWKEPFRIDLRAFGDDIDNHLWFDSNIPYGYGLGSSGALIAAIFRKYGLHSDANYYLQGGLLPELRDFLAALESYYHGKSSGLDPLVSFLNKPVQVSGSQEIKVVETKWTGKSLQGAIFLIDSGAGGDTGPLVQEFRQQYAQQDYKKRLDQVYLPLVQEAIHHYLDFDSAALLDTVKKISTFQLEHMQKMIPESIAESWKKGLEGDLFSMKLCGSGGGGMYLGFTSDLEAVVKSFPELVPIIVHRL
ncbi:MAG: mevalonate kinase [bacterium]